MRDLTLTQTCPDCREDPPNVVEAFSSGDMVCASCGLVLGSRIVDTRSEWRTFSNDDSGGGDPSRVGEAANPLLNGPQLETSISFKDGLTGRAKELSRTLNKTNVDKTTRQLQSAYREIGSMCEAIDLPRTVVDAAKLVFKLALDNRVVRGKTQESVVAACIYIACKHAGVPRTFREVCALTQVPKKEIGKVYKILERQINSAEGQFFGGMAVAESLLQQGNATSAEDLMARFCNRLGLSLPLQALTKQLVAKAGAQGTLAGRSPISIAAAGIYFMSALLADPKSAKEIADVAGVSDSTIRNAYRYLFHERDNLIEPHWLEGAGGRGKLTLLPSI